MIMLIIACIVSFIPCIALLLWLRNRIQDEEAYKKLCDKALIRGILCIFPVTLLSAASHILLRLTGLQNTNPLLYQALYKGIVLALMEELAKYLAFRRLLGKTDYSYSWLDVTAIMTIVGIGFDLIESIVYAIGASVPVVLIRGICIPHAGYGFVVGYFYGKALKTGRPINHWIGFAIAWLIHGMYDFSLSEEFLAINDNLVFIPFILAALDIALVIILIVFAKKAKKREAYTEPLLRQKQDPEITDENEYTG